MTAWMALVALLFAFCLDRWFGEPVPRWPAPPDGGQAQALASRAVLALVTLASLAILVLRPWNE